MSRWITERLPEWEDSDDRGEVWVWRGKQWKLTTWDNVLKCEPWTPTNRPAGVPEVVKS